MPVTSYATSQECYAYISGTDQTVGANTRPSEGALDLYRGKAKTLIYKFIKTTTDSNDVAKYTELDLVRMQWLAIESKVLATLQLTEDMARALQDEFNLQCVGSHEPNQDGAITG